MSKLGALIASGITGTVIWALMRTAQQQQAANAAGAQPVAYVQQPKDDKRETRAALIGGVLELVGSLAQRGVDRPPTTLTELVQPAPPVRPATRPVQSSSSRRGVSGLLDLIGRHEAPRGYNQVYGGSKIQPPKPITTMTIREVLAWQDASVRAGSRSSAAGRYQIIRGTLRGLVGDGAASMSDLYSARTQDRLAIALMERRGLGAYRAGRLSETQFAQNLSQEWASFPVAIRDRSGRPANGQSYYAGDGLNRAGTSLSAVINAIRGIT